MANYGWSLYEQAEYVDSYEWFSNSIREDLDYQDGYNGWAGPLVSWWNWTVPSRSL